MPKRPRQAHIPRQAVKKRRTARRDSITVPADAYLDTASPVPPVLAYGAQDPVGPIPNPFERAPRAPRIAHAAPRPGTTRAAGQLPTFERAYLVEELRRIGMTAGSLLAVIIVLTIVLR